MSDLVRNPEDRFSCNTAHIKVGFRVSVRCVDLNKNSAEVDIAPAFGEITTACNVGQAKNGSWCLLEE